MWTGSRLIIGVTTFAFAGLGFAYFYLRSFNSDDLWRPNHVTAPTDTGTAIFAIVIAAAALNAFGVRHLKRGLQIDWEVAGWVAVAGGLLATGLQIWEYTELGWYPGSSGYASCFVGWGALNIALLLGSVYWLETLLAQSDPAAPGARRGRRCGDLPTATGADLPGVAGWRHLLLVVRSRDQSRVLAPVLRDHVARNGCDSGSVSGPGR